ncbi:MAG: 5,10-methenyltetrahydrofolate synthetase [Candidatus Nitrosothermus koennekii]|nr:MAG: 5,10-methenyltetrahydrofolate synthetase [Candidatus Nitrosothermus koennekii]
MKISYELNPPRILNGNFDYDRLNYDLKRFYSRVAQIKDLVDSIHLTDSVLGVPRVSSITLARDFDIKVRCSLRVRDRNFLALLQLVTDAIFINVDGLLIIKGDEPRDRSIDSGLKPSKIVKQLNELGFSKKIKLFLSVPCNPSKDIIEKKVSAEPYGLITQTISSIDNLIMINDIAKANGVKVLPCIMIPSEKNKRSAEMIGLDWSNYINDPYSFIKRAYDICGEVLMTSPMSFDDGVKVLRRLKQ